MYGPLSLSLVFVLLLPTLAYTAVLENPGGGNFYSGIGLVSGWKCEANGPLTVQFNGAPRIPLVYGNERIDVRNAGACPSAHVGFVSIINWGNLGDGTHTAVAYDNGVEFARSTFTVTTAGEPFLRGARGECRLSDFPDPGEVATFEWNQNTQHLELVGHAGGGGPGSRPPLTAPDSCYLGCCLYLTNWCGVDETVWLIAYEAPTRQVGIGAPDGFVDCPESPNELDYPFGSIFGWIETKRRNEEACDQLVKDFVSPTRPRGTGDESFINSGTCFDMTLGANCPQHAKHRVDCSPAGGTLGYHWTAGEVRVVVDVNLEDVGGTVSRGLCEP